jgi:hypothetical protein
MPTPTPSSAKPGRLQLRQAGLNLTALELAIDEFLEEGYAYQLNRREIEETPDELRAEAIREMLPRRSQTEGYFSWLRYLVWLDGVRELAPEMQYTAVEIEGLSVLRRARNRFQRSHPPCWGCGMPNDVYQFSCHHCGKEIKR